MYFSGNPDSDNFYNYLVWILDRNQSITVSLAINLQFDLEKERVIMGFNGFMNQMVVQRSVQ